MKMKLKLLSLLLLISSAVFSAARPKTPTISSISPTSGYVGTSVTINGGNFSNATAVKIGTTLQSFRIVSSSRITFTVASGSTTGAVSVSNSAGTATGATFTVLQVVNPLTITSVSPLSGPIGTQVNLTGTGFTAVNVVKLNGVSIQFSTGSNSSMIFIVPPGSTTGNIVLSDIYGNVANGPVYTVTANTLPYLYSISPLSGPPGTVVTLTGDNLLGVTSVKLGNTPVTFTIVSNSVITFIAPSTPMFNVSTNATNANGTFWPGPTFSVVVTNPPVITSVTPSVVPIGGTVTMLGRYFSTVSQVYIGNIVVPAISTWSDTMITFYVTNNLVSGWMTVVNAYGTSSGPYLTITTPSPRIRNVSEASDVQYYDMMGRYLGTDYSLLPSDIFIIVRRNDGTVNRIIKQ